MAGKKRRLGDWLLASRHTRIHEVCRQRLTPRLGLSSWPARYPLTCGKCHHVIVIVYQDVSFPCINSHYLTLTAHWGPCGQTRTNGEWTGLRRLQVFYSSSDSRVTLTHLACHHGPHTPCQLCTIMRDRARPCRAPCSAFDDFPPTVGDRNDQTCCR